MNADRNLLFGVLALQLDFISQPQLIAGMQAWVTEKSLPLSAHLVRLGHLSAGKAALLEPLVDEHVRQHGDDPAQSLRALSSVAPVADALNPLAGHDAEIAISVRHLGRSRPSAIETALPSQAVAVDPNATNVEPYVPQSLTGRFRILRPHAKGGLGQVSVAKDTELGRDVAFKEIQPAHADDRNSRGRFVLEAEITGGLEHPGIVPVYGLGTYPDGRPFYAMRFIQGDSLKEAIKRFHSPAAGNTGGSTKAATERNLQLRELLGRFVDVCQAVAYAHSRGVLHRDLKPDNIMLGKYGETLVVDWGLAKAAGKELPTVDSPLEPASLSGSGIAAASSGSSDIDPTQTGQVLGTLAYMSPEQAAGKISDLGPATDIYSLGATLYHLLTGQSSFAHWTNDVDFGARLTDIQQGRFSPPSSIVPTIPAALNAICLKAMAVKPADRYPSLAALANDVEHWLADEPVAAYSEPVTARAARWTRKHRAAVTAGVSTVLVASLALVLLTGITWKKNAELEIANGKEREATVRERQAATEARNQTEKTRRALVAVAAERTEKEAQRKLAEANADAAKKQSQLAFAVLNGVIYDLSGSLKSLPGGGEIRRTLMQTALKQLDGLATSYIGQSKADRTTATALSELSTVVLQIGGPTPQADGETLGTALSDKDALLLALRLAKAAHKTFKSLAEAAPTDPWAQRDLSVSYERLGEIFSQMGDVAATRLAYQQSLEIRKTRAAAAPTDALALGDLVVSYTNMGRISLLMDDTKAALESYRIALQVAKRLAIAAPTDIQAQRNLAKSYASLARVDLFAGDFEAAREGYQQGLSIARMLLAAAPADAEILQTMSVICGGLGSLRLKTGDLKGAQEACEQSLDIQQKLVDAAPSDAPAQRKLWSIYHNLGVVHQLTGDFDAARIAIQHSLAIHKKLVDTTPSNVADKLDMTVGYANLAALCETTGDLKGAREAYQNAFNINKNLAEAAPTETEAQRRLSVSYIHLGDISQKIGDLEFARASYQGSLAIQKTLAAAMPTDARTKRDLQVSYRRLGDFCLKNGDLQSARDAYQRRLEIQTELVAATPADVDEKRNLAESYNDLGELGLQTRDDEAAMAAFQKSLEIVKVLAAAAPTDADAQRNLSISYHKLGKVSLQTNDFEAARASYEQCLEIRRNLVAATPTDAQAQRDLLPLYEVLGEIDLRLGKADSARATFEQGLEIAKKRVAIAPTDVEALNDLSKSSGRLGDLSLKMGDIQAARDAYKQRSECEKKLAAAAPADGDAQRSLIWSLEKLGDASLWMDDMEGARLAYQQLYEIAKKQAEQAAPSDFVTQRNLFVAHYKLGDMSLGTGDLEAARTSYEQSLVLAKQLAAAAPGDAAAQRDLWFVYGKLGEAGLQARDMSAAREAYENCLETAKKLAVAAPSDVQAQCDLAVSNENLAKLNLQTGDLKAARKAYQHCLEIRQKLAAAWPSDVDILFELAISYENLGDVNLQDEEAEAAREAFQQSLEIFQKLAATAPTAAVQRAPSVAYERLGDVNRQMGDPESARKCYQQSLEIRKKLAAAAPIAEQAQRDLSNSYRILGELDRDEGRYPAAKMKLNMGIDVLDAFVKRTGRRQFATEIERLKQLIDEAVLGEQIMVNLDLVRVQPVADQSWLYVERMRAWLVRSESEPENLLVHVAEAVRSADALLRMKEIDSGVKYDAACCYSVCVTALDRAKKMNEERGIKIGVAHSTEALEMRGKFQAAALESLKAAIGAGYKNGKWIENDNDWDALRELPEFKVIVRPLMQDVSKPDDGKPKEPMTNDK